MQDGVTSPPTPIETEDGSDWLYQGYDMAKASDNDFPSLLLSEQGSAPTAPAAGKHRVYFKDDGKLYHRINGGTEKEIGGTQPYDIPFYLPGKPPASAVVLKMKFARAVTYPANFSGSKGAAPDVNATATTAFSVKKNGSEIGTIAVATDGTYTFATSSGSEQSFAVDDVLTVVSPTQDATLEGVSWTLVGSR
jgi:hypothetical protein